VRAINVWLGLKVYL